MSSKLFSSLNSKVCLSFLFSLVVLLLAACGASAPVPVEVPAPEVSIVQVEKVESGVDAPEQTEAETQAEAGLAENSVTTANLPDIFNRQIIKNAEVALLVKDTELY